MFCSVWLDNRARIGRFGLEITRGRKLIVKKYSFMINVQIDDLMSSKHTPAFLKAELSTCILKPFLFTSDKETQ